MTSRSLSLKILAARVAAQPNLVKNAKKGDRVNYYQRVVELTSDPQPTHKGYFKIEFKVVAGAEWPQRESPSIIAHGFDTLSPAV